jgi:hypothetical protein
LLFCLCRSWPGEVNGWPHFDDDEGIFSEAVHAYKNTLIDKKRQNETRQDALAAGMVRSVITANVAKMLRPDHDVAWLKIQKPMRDRLMEAANTDITDTEFTSEGASWMQEARRMDEVDAMEGRDLEASEQQVLSQESGRLDEAHELGLDDLPDGATAQQKSAASRNGKDAQGYFWSQRVGRTCITALPVSSTGAYEHLSISAPRSRIAAKPYMPTCLRRKDR